MAAPQCVGVVRAWIFSQPRHVPEAPAAEPCYVAASSRASAIGTLRCGSRHRCRRRIWFCLVGAHDSAKLDSLLELFIKKYVQCHQCGNPETRIKIRKDMIHLMCKARARGPLLLCCNI